MLKRDNNKHAAAAYLFYNKLVNVNISVYNGINVSWSLLEFVITKLTSAG